MAVACNIVVDIVLISCGYCTQLWVLCSAVVDVVSMVVIVEFNGCRCCAQLCSFSGNVVLHVCGYCTCCCGRFAQCL